MRVIGYDRNFSVFRFLFILAQAEKCFRAQTGKDLQAVIRHTDRHSLRLLDGGAGQDIVELDHQQVVKNFSEFFFGIFEIGRERRSGAHFFASEKLVFELTVFLFDPDLTEITAGRPGVDIAFMLRKLG